MLVVLDTGVFVSAAITPNGVASRIVTAGVAGRFEYLLCPRLVGELTGVLARPEFARLVGGENRRRFLAEVVAAGRDASDPADVPAVSRDPDDDYLVALAAGQQAEWIVSGDADLLDILDPPVPLTGLRAFLDLLAAETQ